MYLNTHSYYSLRYGTCSIEQLLEQATALGVKSMALTDINNSSGILDFVRLAQEAGIKPVAGMEFRDGDKLLFIGIARNNKGFMELNDFMTAINLKEKEFPNGNMSSLQQEFSEVFLIYPYGFNPERELHDHEYIGVKPTQINQLIKVKTRALEKMVVLQPVTFTDKASWYLHKNLRAIDHNLLLSHLKPHMHAPSDEVFVSPEALEKSFEAYPQLIKNTRQLLDNCSFGFDYQSIKNKKTFTGNLQDDRVLLEKLALDGFKYRYKPSNITALKRVHGELEIIHHLGFSAYFLITWDIIRYSMSCGYYHVGRGSGANSMVAYCLKITDVDPIELDLYFERFLNPKRSSPPDFDIDYSWKDREEVQEYIFKRYGRKHTAFLGTSVTFKGKSIYRELGKVHGLPKGEIDSLTANPMKEVGKSELTRHIHSIALMMTDFPNQRSIHAGGILISEEPITAYTALDLPPKGFPTTQWDMYVAESIGFEKIDILSQRGIGHIKEAVDIIRANRDIEVDVHQVEKFKHDPKVCDQLRKAETNGCFYIESPAMRGLLKKLRCDNYLTLVAASSIIRPGVARSGMMREYILRFHHPESVRYLHPVMKDQLEETFGVMVYQEDVLKVCHHFAGLDLADADVLRRAMSGKFRSKQEFQNIIDKFFSNCRERGIDEEITREVWRQIESFAGYSFSKAHSASYAVESFQSLYLKAYFPLEFQVAVINNFGGFYHTWVYFYEARRQGGNLHLPCVNRSYEKTSITGKDIFTGFIHVARLENKFTRKMLDERQQNGSFTDLEDLIRRVNPGMEQLILLIRIGAFRFTGKSKAQLLWEAHLFQKNTKPVPKNLRLFESRSKQFQLPTLEYNPLEDAYDEIELLGFPLTMSYFDLLNTSFRGEVMACELDNRVGGVVRMVGLLVTIKYVKTIKGELMHFGTFTDVCGEFFDTTHFPDSLKNYPFRGHGVYLILGKVVSEFGYASVEVMKLAKLGVKGDPRAG
ncbi:MAG: DNA polymerase III subunit alpha [Bacteroidetes bacterium CG18_big_fil_WC_8_21_14_2_50_41_14]|nr:MAG: DNA polymerase III subunit alpha [Bacteroidetes bacterium CG18_big_fil_WC_8_21_14_2_50_41_14]